MCFKLKILVALFVAVGCATGATSQRYRVWTYQGTLWEAPCTSAAALSYAALAPGRQLKFTRWGTQQFSVFVNPKSGRGCMRPFSGGQAAGPPIFFDWHALEEFLPPASQAALNPAPYGMFNEDVVSCRLYGSSSTTRHAAPPLDCLPTFAGYRSTAYRARHSQGVFAMRATTCSRNTTHGAPPPYTEPPSTVVASSTHLPQRTDSLASANHQVYNSHRTTVLFSSNDFGHMPSAERTPSSSQSHSLVVLRQAGYLNGAQDREASTPPHNQIAPPPASASPSTPSPTATKVAQAEGRLRHLKTQLSRPAFAIFKKIYDVLTSNEELELKNRSTLKEQGGYLEFVLTSYKSIQRYHQCGMPDLPCVRLNKLLQAILAQVKRDTETGHPTILAETLQHYVTLHGTVSDISVKSYIEAIPPMLINPRTPCSTCLKPPGPRQYMLAPYTKGRNCPCSTVVCLECAKTLSRCPTCNSTAFRTSVYYVARNPYRLISHRLRTD